ncbi:MAG: nucleoside deaminase [bacterium]
MKKINIDEKYMRSALKEAEKAFEKNEVPIGCVIVKDGKIIARAHNTMEKDKSTFSHAEIKAIKKAQKREGDWRLNNCTLYSTVEPCLMCISASMLARVKRVVFGCREKNCGGCVSLIDIQKLNGLNHNILVEGGILEKESSEMMREFFIRARKK